MSISQTKVCRIPYPRLLPHHMFYFVTLKYICFVIVFCALIFSGLEYFKNYKAESNVNKINKLACGICAPTIMYITTCKDL